MKFLTVFVNEWLNKKGKFMAINVLCGFMNDNQFVFVFVLFGIGVEFHVFYNLSKGAEIQIGNKKFKV